MLLKGIPHRQRIFEEETARMVGDVMLSTLTGFQKQKEIIKIDTRKQGVIINLPPLIKKRPINNIQPIKVEDLSQRFSYKQIAIKRLNKLFPKGINNSHTRSEKLLYLFLEKGSDKFEQDYHVSYAKYLPQNVNDFLEIGTWDGGGILSFKGLYESGNFYTMNHTFGSNGITTKERMEALGVQCYECDQGNVEGLKKIIKKFDVITEDGSHHSDDQIVTFKQMFKNNIKPGGLYIIEDLYCCKEAYWRRGKVNGFKNTILGVIKKVLKGGEWTSQHFTKKESDWLKDNISGIELVSGAAKDSIVYIWKL